MKTTYNFTVYSRETSLERMRFATQVAGISRQTKGLANVSYSELLDRPLMVVAEQSGVSGLIGHVSLRPVEFDDEGRRWQQLSTLLVAPDHQGKGLGNLLVDVATVMAHRSNSNIYAHAIDDNPRGLEYFERFGYEQEIVFGRVAMVKHCASFILAEAVA